MFNYRLQIIVFFILISFNVYGQDDSDVHVIQQIHDEALLHGDAYQLLSELTSSCPGRIGGSENYRKAATFMKGALSKISGVKSYLQPCQANYWKRGDIENVYMTGKDEKLEPLDCTALGNSGSTPQEGIFAEIIEVHDLDTLEKLGVEGISGKIVFFNRPMDPTKTRTFSAYGGAVDQRVYGPARASKYGASAALVRSMTLRSDDNPHTGVTVFPDSIQPIPAIALSTNASDNLSKALKSGSVSAFVQFAAENLGLQDAPTVIGEIKGSEHPEEIILVGGHLDSWDISPGAHDDGAGCVQSVEVLRILKAIGYKPKRTLRCVLFSNEENGLAGGKKYAEVSSAAHEFHLAAIESDAGGFSPRGFSMDADTSVFTRYYGRVNQWASLLEPYDLYFFKGGTGSDISPLKNQNGLLIGLRPDSQRYFDFHHTKIDTIDAVNPRELSLGAAAMASMVYLIDKYGL